MMADKGVNHAPEGEDAKQTKLPVRQNKVYVELKERLYQLAIQQVSCKERPILHLSAGVQTLGVVLPPLYSRRKAILDTKAGKPSKDNRKEVQTCGRYPYTAICLIRSDFGEGTGAFIGANLILTAGHILFNKTGQETNAIEVYACLTGHSAFIVKPAISSVHYREIAWPGLLQDGNDFAIIVLQDCIGSQTGYFNTNALSDAELSSLKEVTVTGYPGDKYGPGAGYKLYECTAKANIEHDSMISYELDTYYGDSGAPVWYAKDNQYYTIGVHAIGDSKVNKATRLTTSVVKDIEEWVKIDIDIRLINSIIKQKKQPTIRTVRQLRSIRERGLNLQESFFGTVAGIVRTYGPQIAERGWEGLKSYLALESNLQPLPPSIEQSFALEAEYICEFCNEPSVGKDIDQGDVTRGLTCPRCWRAFSKVQEKTPTNVWPPQKLFFVTNGYVFIKAEVLATLSNNFTSQKLVVLAAAGMMGTGKSTWLNAVAFSLGMKMTPATMFAIGETTETETQGIWCFPYPLHPADSPDIDILILDLEGLGGISAERPQIGTELKKITLAGFLLSSVLALHTHMRFDHTTLDSLEQALYSCKTLKDDIGVDVPRIEICLSDAEKIQTKKGTLTSKEYISQLTQHLRTITPAFFNSLTITVRCKSEFPQILKTKKDYSAIQETTYMASVREFAKELKNNLKMNLSAKTPMNMASFTSLCSLISETINTQSFERLFQNSIDEVLVTELDPIIENLLGDFGKKLKETAMTIDISATPEDLKKRANVMFAEYRNNLKAIFQSKFSRAAEKSEVLQRILKKFDMNLQFLKAESVLEKRKMEKAIADKDAVAQAQIAKLQTANEQAAKLAAEKLHNLDSELKMLIQTTQKNRQNESANLMALLATILEKQIANGEKTKCEHCTRMLSSGECHCCTACGANICSNHMMYQDGKVYCKTMNYTHEPSSCSVV